MPAYQPGVGISYHDRLTMSDVGNAPDPARRRAPLGTPGRMNGSAVPPPAGMINYAGVFGAPGGKPGDDDIEALAGLFRVGELTVKRWFNMAQPPRNCVPLSASVPRKPRPGQQPPAVPRPQLTGAVGKRIIALPPDTRLRCLLAACLAVEGGLWREPLYTKGDRRNGNEPFLLDRHADTLADAVEVVEDIIDGRLGYMEQMGWVQITIESEGDDSGWNVYWYQFFPEGAEYDLMTPGGEYEMATEGDE